jgi:hypothetical protein
MEWLQLSGFMLLQIQSGCRPFIYFIQMSYIQSIVVIGSWLGSYHKYGTYQAISHNNIEIPMECS